MAGHNKYTVQQFEVLVVVNAFIEVMRFFCSSWALRLKDLSNCSAHSEAVPGTKRKFKLKFEVRRTRRVCDELFVHTFFVSLPITSITFISPWQAHLKKS